MVFSLKLFQNSIYTGFKCEICVLRQKRHQSGYEIVNFGQILLQKCIVKCNGTVGLNVHLSNKGSTLDMSLLSGHKNLNPFPTV